jgi:hypothetical protein
MARAKALLTGALLGLTLGVAVAGCGHAHATDAARSDQEQSKEHPKSKAADQSAHHAVPIATAPEGLLKPGAEDKIRDKLVSGGFMEEGGGSVHTGLLRFQREHDLPATGDPDEATLRKLGLDPDQLLRKSHPAGH